MDHRLSAHILEVGVPRHEDGLILERNVNRNLFESTQLLLHEVVNQVFDSWQAVFDVERVADYGLEADLGTWLAQPLNPVIISVLGIELYPHFGAQTIYDCLH